MSRLALLAYVWLLGGSVAACGGGSGPYYPPGFSIEALGSYLVAPGQNKSIEVTVYRQGGFQGPVSLGVEGAPDGITWSFTPNPATGNSSTLVVAVGESVASGGYYLTVRGIAGSLTHAVPLTIDVRRTP